MEPRQSARHAKKNLITACISQMYANYLYVDHDEFERRLGIIVTLAAVSALVPQNRQSECHNLQITSRESRYI